MALIRSITVGASQINRWPCSSVLFSNEQKCSGNRLERLDGDGDQRIERIVRERCAGYVAKADVSVILKARPNKARKVLKAVLPCAADCGRFRCSVGIGSGRDVLASAPATFADAFVGESRRPTPLRAAH